MRMPKTVVLLGICALTQAGCASWLTPIGEEKFDCNRKENAKSAYCISFRGADDSTQGNLPQSRYDKVVSMSESDKLLGFAPDVEETAKADKKPEAPKSLKDAPALPHQRMDREVSGMPVREAPTIQKVWIKRFVDEDDVLVNSTTVYKEIRPTRWTGFDTATEKGKKSRGANYPHKQEQTLADAQTKPLRMDTNPPQSPYSQPAGNSGTAPLAQPSPSSEFDGSLPK